MWPFSGEEMNQMSEVVPVDVYQEHVERAKQEAKEEALKNAIVDILKSQFKTVPEYLRTELDILPFHLLSQLLTFAAISDNIEKFINLHRLVISGIEFGVETEKIRQDKRLQKAVLKLVERKDWYMDEPWIDKLKSLEEEQLQELLENITINNRGKFIRELRKIPESRTIPVERSIELKKK